MLLLVLLIAACGGPEEAERVPERAPPEAEAQAQAQAEAGAADPAGKKEGGGFKWKKKPQESGLVSVYPEEDRPISAELQRVRYLVEEGQCAEARTRLEPILVGPEGKTADPLYWRGRCDELEEKWASAALDFKAATEIDPTFVGAIQHLATAYVMQRDCRSALPYLDHLVELRPEEGISYFNRGHCRYYLKDTEGAIRDAHQACELGHTPSCNLIPRLERRVDWQNGLRERGSMEERAPNEEVPGVEGSREGG